MSGEAIGVTDGAGAAGFRPDRRPCVRPPRTPAAGPVLLVEVSDSLAYPPRERVAAPEGEGGRGLRLAARGALRRGARRAGAGKTVWFELALPG